MKQILKAVVLSIAALTLGNVVKADTAKVTSEPFGFRCEGPELGFTINGCAEKLIEKCPDGVVILAEKHTKPEETPAVVEGIAACAIKPI
jgi:hypothetical protein